MTAVDEQRKPEVEQFPSGWVRIKIGELMSFNYGNALPAKSRNTSGGIPVYGSAGISGTHDIPLVSGNILIVGRKGNAGSVNVSACPCWVIDTAFYCQIINDLDVDFLGFQLRSINLKRLDKSTAIPSLSRDALHDEYIYLPPLPEQQRIVTKIEELFSKLDAGVAELKRTQTLLKRYRQSLLHAAVTGQLSRAWREAQQGELEDAGELLERILEERRAKWTASGKKGKYVEPQGPNVEGLPELPQGWVWASVEQLAHVATGATPLKGVSRYYDHGNIPWVTSGSMNTAFITEPTAYITEIALAETNAKVFPSGTLLMAMYGEGKTRGKVAELAVAAATNQACAALIFTHAEDVKTFVKLVLLRNYQELRRAAAGGVQPNLSLGIIKELTIPLPPLAEQLHIVSEVERRLSILDNMQVTVAAELKRSESTRQSILHRAFSGQLVPQDPNDEPASVLLERIQAEKVAAGAAAIRAGGKRGRKPKAANQETLLSPGASS